MTSKTCQWLSLSVLRESQQKTSKAASHLGVHRQEKCTLGNILRKFDLCVFPRHYDRDILSVFITLVAPLTFT